MLHQVPDGSITPSATPAPPPLIDFDRVSSHIIPKQELCDRLVTVCTNKFRLLGHPVCIDDDRRYERNEFIFNFAILLDEDDEFGTYKSVVRKLAKLFKALEEQSGFLSNEVTRAGVYALIEQVLEDLNNYSECMIPISASSLPRRRVWVRGQVGVGVTGGAAQTNQIPSASSCSRRTRRRHRSRRGTCRCRPCSWSC